MHSGKINQHKHLAMTGRLPKASVPKKRKPSKGTGKKKMKPSKKGY